MTDEEIIRRLAYGEDPWIIDPDHGCTNPLTGHFPADEVQALRNERGLSQFRKCPRCGWPNGLAYCIKCHGSKREHAV